jgi:uncharacterized protein (TIGR03437 family)
MPLRLFKLAIIALVGVPCVILLLNGRRAQAFREGPPAGVTGAPGEVTCVDCHFGGGPNTGGGSLVISGLPATYTAGQDITVTVTITQSGRSRFGFELTVINDGGSAAGTITVTDTTRTQLATGGINGRMYISHTAAGTNPTGPGTDSWSFKWTAPPTSTGRVTFYAAGNAANNDGAQTGDLIYTTSASINPGQVVQPPVTTVSAASFAPNGPVAPLSIAAGFGTNLATTVADAAVQPLPTSLGGSSVNVKDSTGTARLAGLFHVQGNQINYLIPDGTANGAATVTVTSSDSTMSTGTVQINTVAPGIFTANFGGTGVPAGYVVRVKPDNSQTNEPISNGTTAVPIDLGPQGDTVILVIFGTGWRFRTDLNSVTATIRGVAAQVQFAADAPGFQGLDQANILIPRSLAGANANADVVFVVNGQSANTVTINIK